MKKDFEKLWAYLDQNPIRYVDGDSLLEQLYWCYTNANTFDSTEIREQFRKLYRSMPQLSETQFDEVFSVVAEMSASQEKLAFQIGAKIGLRLAKELLAE